MCIVVCVVVKHALSVRVEFEIRRNLSLGLRGAFSICRFGGGWFIPPQLALFELRIGFLDFGFVDEIFLYLLNYKTRESAAAEG